MTSVKPNQKHILFVTAGYQDTSLDDFFNYAICQVNQAEALSSMGYRVTVLSRFNTNKVVSKEGVEYIFVRDNKPRILKRWQRSKALLQEAIRINADIVHCHGFIFPVFLLSLRRKLAAEIKVVVEYHSDPFFKIMRSLQKRALSNVDRLIFANEGARRLWTEQFNFSENHSRLSVECAPSSKYMPRDKARAISGFKGGPVFLWNSRLIQRRDPITVIKAYDQFLKDGEFSNSHFYWMIPDYDQALLKEMKDYISGNKLLQDSITIIEGRKKHNELAPYFNSADYIITGSLDDGYGYGIADAMSCGVVPICTDIPTFRQITNDGKVGVLWEPGNKHSLVENMSTLIRETYHEIDAVSNAVVEYFDFNLSKENQARQMDTIYKELTKSN